MFDTQVITEIKQFNALKEEWNRLLYQSHSNTIFLSWEWISIWWEVFGEGSSLFIITVRNIKKELVGIAPLFLRKTRYYKFPVREITFIGIEHSDWQDFIIENMDTQIVTEIIQKIMVNQKMWDVVNLEQIPKDSFWIKENFIKKAQPEIEFSSTCPLLLIDGNWDGYFKSRKSKYRQEIRNKLKKLNKIGAWEFKVERKVEDINNMIIQMYDVEKRSRKVDTKNTFLSESENMKFLTSFCKMCSGMNWLDFSTLRIHDKIVAYSLGFIYNKVHYGYRTDYDRSFNKLSPGKIVINEKIKWFFENNNLIEVFDFSRGDSKNKNRWASGIREYVRVVFFRDSLYSNIIKYIVFRIRPRIKDYLARNQ